MPNQNHGRWGHGRSGQLLPPWPLQRSAAEPGRCRLSPLQNAAPCCLGVTKPHMAGLEIPWDVGVVGKNLSGHAFAICLPRIICSWYHSTHETKSCLPFLCPFHVWNAQNGWDLGFQTARNFCQNPWPPWPSHLEIFLRPWLYSSATSTLARAEISFSTTALWRSNVAKCNAVLPWCWGHRAITGCFNVCDKLIFVAWVTSFKFLHHSELSNDFHAISVPVHIIIILIARCQT